MQTEVPLFQLLSTLLRFQDYSSNEYTNLLFFYFVVLDHTKKPIPIWKKQIRGIRQNVAVVEGARQELGLVIMENRKMVFFRPIKNARLKRKENDRRFSNWLQLVSSEEIAVFLIWLLKRMFLVST